jgi:hypothetical protein
MPCLILHASGDSEQIAAAVAEAINQFASVNAVHCGDFSAYFAGRIYVASTNELDQIAIDRRLTGATFSIVDWRNWHHIFVDCGEPKITAAGWYSGPFMFGKDFPRCKTSFMLRPPPHPLAREVQFNATVREISVRLRTCEFLDEWTGEIDGECPHKKERIRFISLLNGGFIENCLHCFSHIKQKNARYICGVAQPTEFTMTGEGRHGEYTILDEDHFKYNLVDAKIIVLY